MALRRLRRSQLDFDPREDDPYEMLAGAFMDAIAFSSRPRDERSGREAMEKRAYLADAIERLVRRVKAGR